MKSHSRNICHHSGHHIFPHTLLPPGKTYIYLFITATRIRCVPPAPPLHFLQTLEVILKLGTCKRPASVLTYGRSDCGNYLCHLRLDIFDLGLGTLVETVESG